MDAVRHVLARDLAEKIRAIEGRYTLGAASSRTCIDPCEKNILSTGWAAVDASLQGGLATGLHEFFGCAPAQKPVRDAGTTDSPPLCVLVHLAWRAVEQATAARWMVWVGRACHPYPRVLVRGNREQGTGNRRLLDHSLFVAPRDAATRVWAIDLALRSPAVGAVIADGSGFDKAATQRLQLLARSEMKWVLAARPAVQRGELSAAQTRWLVRTQGIRDSGIKGMRATEEGARRGEIAQAAAFPQSLNPSFPYSFPRWSVELLRCKGLRPTGDHPVWLLEWNRAEGAVNLSAPLVDLAGAAEPSQLSHQQRTA